MFLQGEDVDKFLDGESPDVVLNRFQDNYSYDAKRCLLCTPDSRSHCTRVPSSYIAFACCWSWNWLRFSGMGGLLFMSPLAVGDF